MRGIDRVLAGDFAAAFAATRPPGHHAATRQPMGFCLVNHLAVGALHALETGGIERLAVVDFDVHPGNGTHAILGHDRRVLEVGMHQQGLWPAAETVGPASVALPRGSEGRVLRRAWQRHCRPALVDFRPGLVLVSAGFDAHRDDPLGGLGWRDADYGWLGEQLAGLGVPLVAVLEGGYEPAALGCAVPAFLAGLDASRDRGGGS